MVCENTEVVNISSRGGFAVGIRDLEMFKKTDGNIKFYGILYYSCSHVMNLAIHFPFE